MTSGAPQHCDFLANKQLRSEDGKDANRKRRGEQRGNAQEAGSSTGSAKLQLTERTRRKTCSKERELFLRSTSQEAYEIYYNKRGS